MRPCLLLDDVLKNGGRGRGWKGWNECQEMETLGSTGQKATSILPSPFPTIALQTAQHLSDERNASIAFVDVSVAVAATLFSHRPGYL